MGSLIKSTAQRSLTTAGDPVFSVVAHIDENTEPREGLEDLDVVIDFSAPAALPLIAELIEQSGAALVSGTTGYTPEQMKRLESLQAYGAILHSGNYSIGIAALRHLVDQACRELAGFNIEIVECHHNQKVDAPSGTARLLLDTIIAAKHDEGQGTFEPIYGREGLLGPRQQNEIGVHALRGGTVAGVHTVSFFGEDEEVELTHRAGSRQIFVTGALAAAERMAKASPGLYTFDEIMFGSGPAPAIS
nr:4-hydroxy-tetrahydrodipicolinate reductase [Collinsella urealyticum]